MRLRQFMVTLIGLLFSCALQAAAPKQNSIAAVVNDSIITTLALDDATRDAVNLLQRTFYNQPDVLRKKVDTAYDEALQTLIERELVLDEFKKSGGVMPEAILDDEVQKRIRVSFNGDRVNFIKTLQARGLTTEAYREQVKNEMIVQYMLQKNVTSVSVVSPAKIEIYYQEKLNNYKLGEQAKLRVIVFNPNANVTVDELFPLAREVSAKVQGGASFAEMAAVYSDGSQRQKSGDWGWLEQNQLKRGLADVAFALQPGKPSGVIGLASELNGDYWIYEYDAAGRLIRARQYSSADQPLATKEAADLGDPPKPPAPPDEFYLMLVEEKRAARIKTLPEVREEIEKELAVQEREKLRRRWIDRLKEKAFIRYF
jgi:parvulin-like peptidyl-prolyl isomerase